MKTNTLLLLGAVAAVIYFILKKPTAGATVALPGAGSTFYQPQTAAKAAAGGAASVAASNAQNNSVLGQITNLLRQITGASRGSSGGGGQSGAAQRSKPSTQPIDTSFGTPAATAAEVQRSIDAGLVSNPYASPDIGPGIPLPGQENATSVNDFGGPSVGYAGYDEFGNQIDTFGAPIDATTSDYQTFADQSFGIDTTASAPDTTYSETYNAGDNSGGQDFSGYSDVPTDLSGDSGL